MPENVEPQLKVSNPGFLLEQTLWYYRIPVATHLVFLLPTLKILKTRVAMTHVCLQTVTSHLKIIFPNAAKLNKLLLLSRMGQVFFFY